MMHSLFFVLFMLATTACITTGKVGSEGYTHDRLGYVLSYAQPADKQFINSAWKLQVDPSGQPRAENQNMIRVSSKSQEGFDSTLWINSVDLFWSHRETNGVIWIQSFPLAESDADKKLAIIASNYSERLSGLYYVSLGRSNLPGELGVGKNVVTTIVDSKAGTIGSAETYEVVIDVANAEQLKLNPQHRLLRYKMLLVRPRPANGWKEARPGHKQIRNAPPLETYPALIVLTYAMDHAYYQNYVADFDGLVGRFKPAP